MHMTLNAALEILATGNEAAAWEVAQQDEGLNPDVTMAQWVAFGRDALDRRAAEAQAWEACR